MHNLHKPLNLYMQHPPIMCDRLPAQSRDASAGRASSDLYVDLQMNGTFSSFALNIQGVCCYDSSAEMLTRWPVRAATIEDLGHACCERAHEVLFSKGTAAQSRVKSGATGQAGRRPRL